MLSELTVDLWAHRVPAAPHGKNPNQDASGSGSPDTSGRGRVHLGLGAGKVAAGLALPEVEWGVWGLTRPPSALASPRPPPGASSPRPGSSGSQCHTHVHCCQPAGLLRWAVRVEPVCRRRCDLVRALSLLPGGRSIHLRGARLRAQPGNHGHRPESPEPPGKQEAQGNSGESPPSFSIHTDCRSGGARHCPRLL